MTRKAFLEAPTLATERLILRGYRVEDFPHMAAAWTDPEVARYIGQPSTEEESWARFLRNSALWPMLGYGYWAATEKSSGRYCGDVGFADFKRNLEPSIKGAPEIGWVLAREFHGRGYATEAAQAALRWLESALGAQRNGPGSRREADAERRRAKRGAAPHSRQQSLRQHVDDLSARREGLD